MYGGLSLLVLVMAVGLLICNWWVGEQQTRAKLILTLVYFASWLLLVFTGLWAVIAVQALFAIVVGMMTFGIDWMMKRR